MKSKAKKSKYIETDEDIEEVTKTMKFYDKYRRLPKKNEEDEKLMGG